MATESAPTPGLRQTRFTIGEEHTHRGSRGDGVEVGEEDSQWWVTLWRARAVEGPREQFSPEKWPLVKQISAMGGKGIKRAGGKYWFQLGQQCTGEGSL